MAVPRTAFLHYSAPPTVGGVETVLYAHAESFLQAGYPVSVIAGTGSQAALPAGAEFIHIPMMDTRYPEILKASALLELGSVPEDFDTLSQQLENDLAAALAPFDNIIIHNVFSKHFNLPLTAALDRIMDQGQLKNPIAWCHDLSWTSKHSRQLVHPGFPWDLLRKFRPDMTYVAISEARKQEMVRLYSCRPEKIKVIYNGVNPKTLLGLSEEGEQLIHRLGILDSDLILLMPVRITEAKNIEYALQVTASLKVNGLQVKTVLTGPPDPHDEKSMLYFDELKKLRHQLGLEHDFLFVFEFGPQPMQPYTIDQNLVGELYRVSDFLFMPSHREGFGLPVLEAGFIGIPVICTDIPAATEVGGEDVLTFSSYTDPDFLAEQIELWMSESPVHKLRSKVRKNFTWQMIFQHDIRPLLR